MNVPLGLVAIASAVAFLHLPTVVASRPKVDMAGIGLLTVASVCLVLMSTWAGTTYAWASPQIIGLLVLTAIAAAGFVLVERRAAEPIMPLHLFRNRDFDLTTIAGLATGIAMFGTLAFLPTYL